MIEHVAVIIPARNEADRIERCLRSVLAAARACTVPASIVVVADSCTDDTAARVRTFPAVELVETAAGGVGVARRLGVEQALAAHAAALGTLWLANTDADSVVPPNWLSMQLGYAAAGYDVLIGTVRPDPAEYPAHRQREWAKTHIPGRPNGHTHGANLGVRATAYLAAGGYRDLPEHEDVDLVERLRAFPTAASDDAEVVTSARFVGRTPGGYAGYLRLGALRDDAAVPGP